MYIVITFFCGNSIDVMLLLFLSGCEQPAGSTSGEVSSSVAIIGGVITDIIFSGRENKLLDSLEAQGIFLSVTPTIEAV